MKILITGISGFAGSHLAEYCLSKDAKVFGTTRWRSNTENINHIKDKLHLLDCDIRDSSSVLQLLDKVRPNYIFHLAAQSFVPTSWNAPTETLTTNIIGELNIFEAIRKLGMNPTVHPMIQIACSSEEYGMVYESETPVKETNQLRPLSPYGVSKVAQDLLGYQYHQSYGFNIIRTRAFNHEGPRRGSVFVISNFAKQIAEIELGIHEPIIKVGNLDSLRDFTDVRDMVRAYWLALEKGEPGDVYNIASGRAVKIGDMLNMLLGMSKVKIKIEKDASRMRPSDVPILLGDSTKFREKTGWQPEIPFEKTVEDTLNYWRGK